MPEPSPGAEDSRPLERALLRRALEARDPGRLQLRFDAGVVDRYRARAGARLLRTRSVGRVQVPGRWSLDLGLARGPDGREVVHLPAADLLDRLPREEWEHWVSHLEGAPASASYLQMRMSPGACIDDGEPGEWT